MGGEPWGWSGGGSAPTPTACASPGCAAGRGRHRSEDCDGEVIRVRCAEKEGLALSVVGRGQGSVVTRSLIGLSTRPKEVSPYDRGGDSRVHEGAGGWELRQLVLDKRGWRSRTSDWRCLGSRCLRCPAQRRGHSEGCARVWVRPCSRAVGRTAPPRGFVRGTV